MLYPPSLRTGSGWGNTLSQTPSSWFCNGGSTDNLWSEAAVWYPNGNEADDRWVCRYSQFTAPDSNGANAWWWSGPLVPGQDYAPRAMNVTLGTIDYKALLDTYAPYMMYDSQEPFQAIRLRSSRTQSVRIPTALRRPTPC